MRECLSQRGHIQLPVGLAGNRADARVLSDIGGDITLRFEATTLCGGNRVLHCRLQFLTHSHAGSGLAIPLNHSLALRNSSSGKLARPECSSSNKAKGRSVDRYPWQACQSHRDIRQPYRIPE